MDLYQEIILEHSRRPHHAGLREPFNAQVHHVNPTCGDEVTLRVQLSKQGESDVISDLSYDAVGCSISTASTSVLTDEVIGHSVDEALSSFSAMRRMLTSKGADPGDEDEIGDGVAFAGVSRYPARVKCALLGWLAFMDALNQAGIDTSEVSTSGGLPFTVINSATNKVNSVRNNSVTNNSVTNNSVTNNGGSNSVVTNSVVTSTREKT
jgi:nitrogen fixation protein NifU and related proteins